MPPAPWQMTQDALDRKAIALFIRRHGREIYESGEAGETLERIEQPAEEYDPVFLSKHLDLKGKSITVYHDPLVGDDWAVVDNETGEVIEIFNEELWTEQERQILKRGNPGTIKPGGNPGSISEKGGVAMSKTESERLSFHERIFGKGSTPPLERLGRGQTVNDLMPMPPEEGPPLPRVMAIRWPWKK